MFSRQQRGGKRNEKNRCDKFGLSNDQITLFTVALVEQVQWKWYVEPRSQ